jgi:hypothetical protein
MMNLYSCLLKRQLVSLLIVVLVVQTGALHLLGSITRLVLRHFSLLQNCHSIVMLLSSIILHNCSIVCSIVYTQQRRNIRQ